MLHKQLKKADCVKHKKVTRVYNGAVSQVYYHNNNAET